MILLDIIFLVAGVVLLVIGYRRSHRGLLLAAALCLLLTGTLSDFMTGFARGLDASASALPPAAPSPA